MEQTAIQEAIAMVRSRIESIDETLMGKHSIHHLQQIERGLYELLKEEKEQIQDAYWDGIFNGEFLDGQGYYNETYGDK
jgi:hypothetical protein